MIRSLRVVMVALALGGCGAQHVPPPSKTPEIVEGPERQEVPHGILFGEMIQADVPIFVTLVKRAIQEHASRLVLRIDTEGGEVAVAQLLPALMDEARDQHVKIVCVVDGKGWSAGFYLLQMCDERYMTKRSTLMTHNPSVDDPDAGADPQVQQMTQNISWAWAEGCGHRLKISMDEYRRRTDGKNWWMTWPDALRFGAVDGVVDEPRSLWE